MRWMRRSSRSSTWSLRGTVGKVDFDLLTKVEREHTVGTYYPPNAAASSNAGTDKGAAPGGAYAAVVSKDKLQCYFCNGYGHMRNKCPKFLASQVDNAFAASGKGGKAPSQPPTQQQQLALTNGGKNDKGKGDKGKGNKGKVKKGAKY
jgi:hypothetical protein